MYIEQNRIIKLIAPYNTKRDKNIDKDISGIIKGKFKEGELKI